MNPHKTHARLIIESDNDFPEIITSVSVYFKWNNDLVIELERKDLERPQNDYLWEAVVDSEETGKMARFLHTQPENLPDQIFERFQDTSYCAPPSKSDETFRDILNFVLDCGIHYRLKKSS